MAFQKGKKIKTRVKDGIPVVSVTKTIVRIAWVRICGNPHSHYLYRNSDRLRIQGRIVREDVKGWARGPRWSEAEWVAGRPEKENFPACGTRLRPVCMEIGLMAETPKPIEGKLKVNPTINGKPGYLKPKEVPFTYPAGSKTHPVTIETDGQMPNWVGKYLLELKWEMKGKDLRFQGPPKSRITLYSIYGQPLLPAYDSNRADDRGTATSQEQGTLTGTPKRFDLFMDLLDKKKKRHPVATKEDVEQLIWRIHCGANNTPRDVPPHFDNRHDESMTVDGTRTGRKVPVVDQWAAWASSSPLPRDPKGDPTTTKMDRYWNDMACIGYVTLVKTMLASIGIFARRTWVIPHTTMVPGQTKPLEFADSDLYMLGDFDESKFQTAKFTFDDGGVSRTVEADLGLIEHHGGWENFEACLRTPGGKFLPGGFGTGAYKNLNRFDSALELLQWWVEESTQGSFLRFQAWAWTEKPPDGGKRKVRYWDLDGRIYDKSNFKEAYPRGLPVPRTTKGP